MSRILHLKSIADLLKFLNVRDCLHPLVAIVDFSQTAEQIESEIKISTDFYSVMFKNYCKSIVYGRKTIDFNEGSLICMAPSQVLTIENELELHDNPIGWGLFFHPDLIRNTTLYTKIKEFSFFSYEISEALHLSEKERVLLIDCLSNIKNELKENIDYYSQSIIVSSIELLLNYCNRFYGRQFLTRKAVNKAVVEKIEIKLLEYYQTDKNSVSLPTVKYLADAVNLSPGYLGDLLKKETGFSAQEHIHKFIIDKAKTILINSDKSVSEIAYSLGFEYPQYFSRLFKLKTGKSPNEFRKVN